MKALAAAALMALAGGALAANAPPAPGLVVTRSAVCTAVADHEPYDPPKASPAEFGPGIDRVIFWLDVKAARPPRAVKIVWMFGGADRSWTTLRIKDARARTWSDKKVHPGDWRVEARDESGAVLAAADFRIAGKARAARAPTTGAAAYPTYAKLYARLAGGATAAALEDVLPRLSENLAAAAAVSAAHWTDCTPYDELAKADILPAGVMAALGIPRAVTGGVAHAPAGLMHTYGYLFSQLPTAYGLKGKRWLESRLDERLGLPAGTFGPEPPRGEFAANVTSALLSLIGAPEKIPGAADLAPRAKVLGHIEQRVTWKTPDGKVAASVFTDLAGLEPLPGSAAADADLLIYSVLRDGRRRLVTVFPIDAKFAAALMASKPDRDAAFVPRFNLYVDPSWKVAAQESLGFVPAAD